MIYEQVNSQRSISQRVRLGVAAIATSALVLSPSIAAAQSCANLEGRLLTAKAQMARLVVNYTGVAMVGEFCAAVGDDVLNSGGEMGDAVGAFLVCAAVGCALVGPTCKEAAGPWFVLRIEIAELTTKVADCRRR